MSWWGRRDPHVVIRVDPVTLRLVEFEARDGARIEIWKQTEDEDEGMCLSCQGAGGVFEPAGQCLTCGGTGHA